MSTKARKREIRKLKRAGLPVVPKVLKRRRNPIAQPELLTVMAALVLAGSKKSTDELVG